MTMTTAEHETMRKALKALAPGTDLREGLERIQRGHTGALIVLGYNKEVEALCSGGFELDVASPARACVSLQKWMAQSSSLPTTNASAAPMCN